ncbi:cytochrome P450 [Paracoccus sp. DMF-8]|uniref:cytochrome P450 n=1 Tax=Paracoccus sp. DMF-8 TaxID=3019445 RepID=UPI0023E3FD3F|nr:cytochrome P450 [Paracoccus sp. DMF-8]MDF3607331.1 cytochrome P450 [Paracoccus sp. DMF-8]
MPLDQNPISAYPPRVALNTRVMGVIGSARTARRNILELLPEIATRQLMVSGRTGLRWHMVMDPAALRRIFKDNLQNYPRSEVTRLILEPAIGQSMFVAEGANWRWQRLAAAPAFAQRNIQALAPVMSAAAAAGVRRLEAATGPINALDEMIAATFEVISDVTFSGGAGLERRSVHRAIETYTAGTAKLSVLDVLGAPRWVPRPVRMFSGRQIRDLKSISDAIIDDRRRTGPHPVPDLLDLLQAGVDPETGRTMTTAELRDNLLTFIVAGHETTALSMAWALYLCAFDPAVQDRAAAEARAVLGDRIAGAGDVAKLPYIRQIIDESLRLYPPAGMVTRTARAPDRLAGRDIRKGDTVMIPFYALHRNHVLWDDPDRFDPDRFAPGITRDRFAFLPFGAGPRICIGAGFAVQEAVIILASLLARYRFATTDRHPQPRMIVTLRPHGGVWLTVSPR